MKIVEFKIETVLLDNNYISLILIDKNTDSKIMFLKKGNQNDWQNIRENEFINILTDNSYFNFSNCKNRVELSSFGKKYNVSVVDYEWFDSEIRLNYFLNGSVLAFYDNQNKLFEIDNEHTQELSSFLQKIENLIDIEFLNLLKNFEPIFFKKSVELKFKKLCPEIKEMFTKSNEYAKCNF